MHRHRHDHHTGPRDGAHSRRHEHGRGHHDRHGHGHHGHAHHGDEHAGHEVEQYDRVGQGVAEEWGVPGTTVLDPEAPRVTGAGCPKLGGTAACTDDCRTCPNRGVRPA
jgi:hypothetical protein